MKRVSIVLMGICFVVCCTASAHAWFGGKKKDAPANTVEPKAKAASVEKAAPSKAEAPNSPVENKAAEKAFRDKLEAAKKKMAQLNNTEWQIEMTPISGKGKKEAEVISFKDSKVTASSFSKKGFPATNISLTIQDDGTVIWETMQTSEKAGICFWRGELDKAVMTMRGVLSHKIDDKSKMDYSFLSISRRVLPADK
jgi:hypothetical protein